MKKITATLLISVVSVSVFAGVQINGVPPTYDTIQGALTNAPDGATLIVSTGLYEESVNIFDRSITIDGGYNTDYATKAASGDSVIDGDWSGGPFSAPGSIIDISNSVVRLIDMSITDGGFADLTFLGYGAGLDIRDGSFVTAETCQIHSNICKGYGGGIYVNNSSLVISNSPVYNNVAKTGILVGSKGGGIYVENGNVTLIGMAVSRNNYANEGGGVAADNAVLTLNSNADVYGNTALTKGGGILLENNSSALFTDGYTVIGASSPRENSVTNGSGGGLYASDSSIVLSNSARFLHNFASADGGGAYLTNSAMTIVDASIGVGLTYCTNFAKGNGGGVYALNSTLNVINGGKIYQAFAGAEGGGIYAINSTILYDNALLGHSDTNFGSRAVGAGGGLYADNCSSVFENAEIINNQGNVGGGLEFTGSNYFLATNSRFCGNRAGFGGGIDFRETIGSITIDSCSITNNRAYYMGGGIMVGIANTLNIRGNSEISYNTADDMGGGIALYEGGSVDIFSENFSPIIISDNIASNNGGGINGFSGSSISVAGNIWLRRNHAQFGGGICISNACSLVITNSSYFCPRIFGNEAAESGGGILLFGPNTTAKLKNAIIGGENIGNISLAHTGGDGGGGGIAAFDSAKLEAINCVFQENFAANSGAALLLRSGAALSMISDFKGPLPSLVINNFCTNAGGGICANSASEVNIEDYIIISNNTSSSGGGGIYIAGTTNSLVNNVIAQNDCGYASGADGVFFFDCPESKILQCTIADNDRNGIENMSTIPVYMTNCIVYGHSVSQIWASFNVSIVYSDIEGGWPGTGNITNDPMFADPAALDYQLLDGSPCIDEGASLACVTNDCIGTFRPQGLDWDMGAYEFVPEPAAMFALTAFLCFLFRKSRL